VLERIKAPLQEFRVYRALRFAYHFAADGTFRADQIMRVRRPRNLFQYRSLTFSDRYPVIFDFVRARLAAVAEPGLLSFGCATGEEVFSLRRSFPNATIKGIDINAHNIAVCRARLREAGDPKIEFSQANSATEEGAESYDAIFCLAVFQHSSLQDRAIASCENYIRFEAFEETLRGLTRCLRPGGYLAIRHADFRFTDTACAADFRTLLRIEPEGAPHPRFDRNNRRLPDEHDTDVVFQKQKAAG
jgi:SAM-dependent methyltransferase